MCPALHIPAVAHPTPESAHRSRTLLHAPRVCGPLAELPAAPLRARREKIYHRRWKGQLWGVWAACGALMRHGRCGLRRCLARVWGLPKKRSCLGFFFSGSGANCVVRVCPRPFPNSPLSAGMRAVRYGPLDGTSCPPLLTGSRPRPRFKARSRRPVPPPTHCRYGLRALLAAQFLVHSPSTRHPPHAHPNPRTLLRRACTPLSIVLLVAGLDAVSRFRIGMVDGVWLSC